MVNAYNVTRKKLLYKVRMRFTMEGPDSFLIIEITEETGNFAFLDVNLK